MLTRFLASVLILAFTLTGGAQPYKNLVLKGGGIRGIAYTGALKVLEEKGIINGIEKVAGTSVGAITGTLVSIGYSAQQMEELMTTLDIGTFNDGEWYFIGGQKRLRKLYGWYKGEVLEQWVDDAIKKQTGNEHLTFRQLHKLAAKDRKFKDVTATNLTQQRLEVFSWETYPNMEIQTAVRASVSIPLYYTAVFLDQFGRTQPPDSPCHNCSVFVDGGLVANYPITIFNTAEDNAANRINKHTLGLKLERPEQISFQQSQHGLAPYSISSFNNYMGALYNIVIEQLNSRLPFEEEKKHSIYISTSNLSPKVRKISNAQKQTLYNNGLNAARNFFK